MIGYIYLIVESRRNGRIYVGSSRDFKARWARHTYELRRGQSCNPLLQRTFNKYGGNNLEFLLAEAGSYTDEDLIAREQLWIDSLRGKVAIFNFAEAGRGSAGLLVSAETRAKIGEKSKGRKWSEESRQAQSKRKKGLRPWLGRKHSEESIEKMRQSHRRRLCSKALLNLSARGAEAGLGGGTLTNVGMEADPLQ